MQNKRWFFVLIAAVLVVTSACKVFIPSDSKTDQPPVLIPETAVPTAQTMDDPTALPPAVESPSTIPALDFVLATREVNENSESPKYDIRLEIPYTETKTAWAEHFNDAVATLVNNEVAAFRNNLSQMQFDPNMPDTGSSFEVKYTLVYSGRGLVSLHFEVFQYVTGAAHPMTYSMTLTYDLKNDRRVELADLFQPGSAYLDMLSALCKADLQKQGMLMFEEGTNPTADNFRSWTLTPEGLQVYFDPYQVAPYAAGPQRTLIPYADLQGAANPTGPIAVIMQQP